MASMRAEPWRALTRWPAFAPWLLIVGATWLAWANSLHGSFQFDDWDVIVDNVRVQSIAAWWDSMPGMRPLLKLSYAVDWQLGGGTPFAFHVTNVIVHALNGVLAYELLRRLAPSHANAALLAGLIFALHPVQTEAVTYISGRSSSLAALFCLASLLTAGRWLSPVFFAFALATKETAFVLPLALLLLPACREGPRGSWRSIAREAWPHALVLGMAVLAALAIPRYAMLLESSLATRDPAANLLAQMRAIPWLLGQLLMPWRLNADPALVAPAAWGGREMLAAAGLLASLVLAYRLRRRAPLVTFGILWFYLWLLPTNSLLPRTDLANDRQLYLAMLGPAWLLALAITSPRVPAKSSFALGLVLCVALGTLTHSRNRVYANELVFWQDVVDKAPHNARAAMNLGYAHFHAGDPVMAEHCFRRALAIDPQYTRAGINLMLLKDGNLE